MYKQIKPFKSTMTGIKTTFGESLEKKIQRLLNNREPIKATVNMIYTERSEGVIPAYDVRTDKMELAIDAMDIHQKVGMAKREDRRALGKEAIDNMNIENKGEAGGQSISGTDIK